MKVAIKSNKTKNPKEASNKKVKQVKKKRLSSKKKSIKRRKVVAVIFFILILLAIIALILLSDLFNIKQITVINNSKVSTEEIIEKSTLAVGDNMFKTFKSTIRDNIKSNAYIEDVTITKKLNGEIILDVKERICTYILQMENNKYAYINNQGYILEISEEPLQLPIIKGFSTQEIATGNRMDAQDLKKLDILIQITETAKSNGIKDIITTIDISDENNFILEIPSEGKIVQFGNGTNINVKILWIVDLIEREKGIEGEIILNVPDIKKVYFREKV